LRVLPYRFDGHFVEVTLPDIYSLAELRATYEAIRDDPALPRPAVMLFDARARVTQLSAGESRARAEAFLEILCPRVPAVFAMVVTPTSAIAGKTAQVEASQAGLRIGIFTSDAGARQWLSAYALEDAD
jgi:hypothetical protein